MVQKVVALLGAMVALAVAVQVGEQGGPEFQDKVIMGVLEMVAGGVALAVVREHLLLMAGPKT
jgi:hypothetical protein